MGRHHRRSPEEIAALRLARAQRQNEKDGLDDVGFGGLRYEFRAGSIEVREDWHSDKDGIAGLQWAGGMRLARYFDDELSPEEDWTDRRVLELGAGCGLTSCVLAKLGALVDCTDVEPSFAEETVAANQFRRNPPRVLKYKWSSTRCSSSSYDVIVAGDCLYAESHAIDLCDALRANAEESTTIYLCGAVSPEAHSAFVHVATKSFEVFKYEEKEWIPVTQWDQRSLLKLRLKQRPPLSSVAPATKHDALDTDAAEARFQFTPDPSSVVVPSVSIDGALVVDGALSRGECDALVATVLASPELSFWSTDPGAKRFRDARTLEARLPSVATTIWSRIKDHVQPWLDERHLGQYLQRQDDALLDDEIIAQWRPGGVNDDLLFATYPAGGAFAPHTDGVTRRSLNRRSFYSIILYLNDVDEGGETRFYDAAVLDRTILSDDDRWTADDNDTHLVRGDVHPVAGRLLLFDQDLVHEGRPPRAPERKHIIRTDLLFDRHPPIFDSSQDRAAFDAYENACHHAGDGDHETARRLFEQCRKLSPGLAARLLGA